ncbi:pathogenicity island 2 effector protein SseE [Yersinia aldovae]|uniref:secreted effector protein n=1 Tax=Yersinia aldovae TaxID=29483 RepID=UPI0005DEE4AC|nr:secreted effector protein [Yersinia aldovae]CNH68698.1 pathogenicity island 2 effector protein SseE [Yersinia aldovae]
MDEITRQLRYEGLHPQPAFLAGCGGLIGQQVELYPYRLVYRLDANNLILCSFNRAPESVPQLSSLIRLWGILCRLFHRTPWLNSVRMLVITEVFDPHVAAQRRRLVRLLHRLGAMSVLIDGDNWLEIPFARLLNRRKWL